MTDDNLYRKLLSGEITRDEIQSNPELINMARRVYGKEVFDVMGIYQKEIQPSDANELRSDFPDLDLPRPIDEETVASEIKSKDTVGLSLGNGLKKLFSNPKARRLIIIGLFLRLILAPWTSHSTDIAAHFLGVSDMIHNSSSPYSSLDFSYPPVLMIFLYPLLLIASIFSDPGTWATTPDEMGALCTKVSICTTIVPSPTFNLLLKTPLIFSDIIAGIVIFSILLHIKNEDFAVSGMGIYILNPLTIWVSAVLGQSDSMLSMFVLLSIFYLLRNDLISSGIMFGLSVMTKGYSLPLAVSIGLFAIFFNGRMRKYSDRIIGMEEVIRGMKIGGGSIIVALGLTIPMMTIGGAGVIFSRQIQRPFRPGGVSPFSISRLEFVPTDEFNNSGGLSQTIEFLHSMGLEYLIGIFIIYFLYNRYSKGALRGDESLITGLTLHLYFSIFLLGAINPQYLVVLVGLMSISVFYAPNYKLSILLLKISCFLAAIFGVGVVSLNYDFIPLAAYTEIIDFSRLVDSIITQWEAPGLFTKTSREDRGVIVGFGAWALFTWVLTQICRPLLNAEGSNV
tara:strand:+ start:3479 stop:5176 length:1698 start_codon:yes stop_codon:yes gene_type:complete